MYRRANAPRSVRFSGICRRDGGDSAPASDVVGFPAAGDERFSGRRSWWANSLRSLGSLRALVILGVVVLNLVVIALTASFLADYGASHRRQAAKNAENLSRALEAGLEGMFGQFDLTLRSVVDEYERELNAGAIDRTQLQGVLDRQAARLPDAIGIRVADGQGQVRYAAPDELVKPINITDRDYFAEVRDNPNPGLVVSQPDFGRIARAWILVLARRISGPGGGFAGEVHIALPTDRFQQMFSTLDVGPHGAVAIWNEKGALITRYPGSWQIDNRQQALVRPSLEAQQLLAEHRDGAAYHAVSPIDGVGRLFYLRKVGTFPLYIVVGLADIDSLAEWRSVERQFVLFCVLFFVASVAAGMLIYSRALTKARAEAQSRLAASVYEHSSEGMAILDASGRIVDVNRSFSDLTGCSAESARGARIGRWFSARREAGLLAAALRALRERGNWVGEVWLNRSGGDAFVARMSVSAVKGEGKYVALFADATEQKRAQELIWRHANFDTVTQLPNRRHFCDSLMRRIIEAEAKKERIAVIFIDLDRFKYVNDRFGHAAGDSLLQQAAERIRACLRPSDLVARLGGDEFTVMLPGIARLDDAARLAERIVATLARPYMIVDELTFTSASLGVTLYPDDGTNVETLLRNADQAMYEAKRAGRNCIRAFAAPLQIATATHASLVNDLHSALANDELELHYQPIVEMSTGRIVKAEALARWRHPKFGDVPPAEFIPIAEDTGLIVEIGDWVFRRAADQALRWRTAFDPKFQVSVNVSAAQLTRRDGAGANFERFIARPGLGPGAIIVEITESVLIDAREEAHEVFGRFRRAGIEIALDDFGTGYSSLAYLKDFDISYLKVDRAFVSHLTERPRDFAVCEAVVAMAHKLGIRVVAEGVETLAQRELLAGADCDYGQGYLFARPLPEAEFEALLAAQALDATPRIRA